MSEIINIHTDEQLTSHFTDINIGVITALQSELDALINLADGHEKISYSRTYHKLKFITPTKTFYVIGHSLDQMGIAAMAVASMELINYFPLKYLALIGIAAGAESKTQNLGDILIPTSVYNYESGKYFEESQFLSFLPNKVVFKCDFKSYDIDTDIIQKIRVCNEENVIDQIQNQWPIKQKNKLKIHFGNFACGSAVIASDIKIKEIEKQIARKYIGLDMESFALAAISRIKTKNDPKLFVVKSITDFADKAKGDSAHEYASYTAAKYFLVICEKVI